MNALRVSGRFGVGMIGLLLASVLFGEVQAADGSASLLATMWKWAPLIGQGFLLNILISVVAMTLGTVAGLGLGLGQMSPIWPLRHAAQIVTQFFRNAPWLVLLFYCILLLPYEMRLGGLVVAMPAWIKATVGLALPVMGNVSEIVRGGVQALPPAQWDSAEALAFNRRQTLWMVILPQAIKPMLPPWMNLYAVLIMATPLVSVVGVEEAMTLTRFALSAENRSELLLPMYLALLIAFFAYCYPIARWTARLERRFAVKL